VGHYLRRQATTMNTISNHVYICNCCGNVATVQHQESLVPGRELVQVECTADGCENWFKTRYTRDDDFSSYYTAEPLNALLRSNAEYAVSREIEARLAS
jgi:hypothetical protein